MKSGISIFFFLLCVSAPLREISATDLSTVSKADILATVQHIQSLSANQKAALIKAQEDYQTQGAALQEETLLASQYKSQRDTAERERDALVWIFSIAAGMAALSTFKPALQVVQMPWQLVALAGIFVGGFALGFSIGRWSLHFLAQFTPHLPF